MKMIQIRDVPEPLHRALKERAAREGMTLSDLIKRDLPRIAERPTNEQIFERLQKRREAEGAIDVPAERIVEWIREDRGPLP